jgi:peptide/nickel transport system ATP-binding protein
MDPSPTALSVEYRLSGRGRFGRERKAVAIEGVDLALVEGKVLAIVGESGCGKSTLVRVLAGLVEPTQGSVELDGAKVDFKRRHEVKLYRKAVQLVFQDSSSSLNPNHPVKYTLGRALALAGSVSGMDEKSLLRSVRLEPPERFLGRRPSELSGGQAQRVAIARALAMRPRVLLADEPVSMLDVSVRAGILALFTSLRAEEKLKIVYVTHDVATTKYIADEVTVMYAGQLIEHGSVTDVVGTPAHPYTKLLLAALPKASSKHRSTGSVAAQRDDWTARIPGEPPVLGAFPSGCRFRTRCPMAHARCAEEAPSKTSVGPDHWVSCWLYGPS